MIPKKKKYDLVIVGGGASGLVAAYRASTKGLDVLVLEKGRNVGGSGVYVDGTFAIESPLQDKHPDDEISKDFALKEELEYSHHKADTAAWKQLIDNSADTIKWFLKLGIEFEDCVKLNTGYRTMHLIKGAGKSVIDTMYRKAKANGVEVATSSQVISLNKDVNGKICGVNTQDYESREITNITAKAVVLATGGYLNNREMIKKYTPYRSEQLIPMNSGKNSGDGLTLAWSVGAQRYAMGTAQLFGGFLKDKTKPSYMYRFSELNATANQEALLWVNQVGDRFVDESIIDNFSVAGNALMQQNRFFTILDQATVDHLTNEGIYKTPGTFPYSDKTFSHLKDEIKKAKEEKASYFYQADSLKELAKKAKLPHLEETVHRYNELCKKGKDEDFAKDAQFMHAIETGPFYALEQGVAAYCTMGGLKVNFDNQVLDENGLPIEGLYAIGNDASGILEGDTYGPNMPGTGSGYVYFSGRHVADVIAEKNNS